MNLADRFWAKVERRSEDECWPWTGGLNTSGYGQIGIGSRTDGSRRKVLAHRLAYELTHGPIPHEDLEGNRILVLHTCDNPPCCNPAHLFLGTDADNANDAARKKRLAAKLNEAAVKEIRRLAGSVTQRDLAKRYGVAQSQISNIITGKTWRHIA